MKTRNGLAVIPVVLLILMLPLVSLLSGGCSCQRDDTVPDGSTDDQIPNYEEEGLAPHSGDWFVIGSTQKLGILNPYTASNDIENDVAALLFNGLLTYDDQFNLVGDLAETFTIETSGQTVTLAASLRKDIFWHPYYDAEAGIEHSAVPVEVSDVLYTYRLIKDGIFGEAVQALFSAVESFEQTGPRAIKITFNGKSASHLFILTAAILPQKILEQYADVSASPFWVKPCGTGPFRFSRWEENEAGGEKLLYLESFDSYFEGKPYLAGVKVARVSSRDTLFNLIRSRQIDFTRLPVQRHLKAMSLISVAQRYRQTTLPRLSYTFVGFNFDSAAAGAFQDKKMRRALASALDTKGLIDSVLYGFGVPVHAPISPAIPGCVPDSAGVSYDPEAAAAVLDEYGWTDTDGDGFRDKLDDDGVSRRLQLALHTNKDFTIRLEVAEKLAAAWRSLGVDVDIREEEWNIFLGETLPQGNFEAALVEWNHGPWPMLDMLWHSRSSEDNRPAYFSFASNRVDEILDRLSRVTDQGKRRELIKQSCALIQEELPGIFLYSRSQPVILHKRFKNVPEQLSPVDTFAGIHLWFVPEKWQLSRE